MKALLVVNAAAGCLKGMRNDLCAELLRDEFRAAGIEVEVRLAPAGKIAAQLRAAAAERPAAIYIAGGDGTLSTAAGELSDTGISLGPVPLGTLNHFARDLGMPVERREAIAALAQGYVADIDVGEVNGRVFINNCSIGSYPEAVRKRDALRRMHGTRKWPAMLLASLSAFRRLRRFRVHIVAPDTRLQVRTPFILVANNRYTGNLFNDCLRPQLHEGRLFVYTTRAHRRLALLRLAWQSLTRTIDAADGLETHALAEATITPARGGALPLAIDGELANLPPPLRFRIRPRALRVITPKPPAER
jgi:diacylglycerol kinase family enzyme